jgi:SulP family sulfate permease
VVLDATHLVALDTSGLDALRQLHKAIVQRGGSLRLEALNEQPRSLIERSGFAQELAVHRVSEETPV